MLKCFRRVGGFVNITDPEGGPSATGMIPEGGTTEKSCRPPPPPPTGQLMEQPLNSQSLFENWGKSVKNRVLKIYQLDE